MGSRGTVDTSIVDTERGDSHGVHTAISRRRTLQLAGVTAASVAGCTVVPFGADDRSGGREGDSSFDYTRWLYAPGTAADVDHYRFRYLRPASIAEHEEDFEASVYSRLAATESRFGITDLEFGEVEHLLDFGLAIVLGASFDRGVLVEELTEHGLNEDDKIGGYTPYYDVNEDTGVAITTDGILLARGSGIVDAQDVIEGLVETRTGGEPRYVDSSDAFAELCQMLGNATVVEGGTREQRAVTAASMDIRYGETVSGSLQRSDERAEEYGRDGYFDAYQFLGTAGDSVEITMDVPRGDTYLLLEGPDGSIVAENDDHGTTLNSRIRTELPTTGVYTIVATSWAWGATFDYRVSLEALRRSTGTASGDFPGRLAQGSALTVDGETASRTWVLVFADADDVPIDDIESWVGSDDRFVEYEDLQVERADRAALITGAVDTGDVSLASDEE